MRDFHLPEQLLFAVSRFPTAGISGLNQARDSK